MHLLSFLKTLIPIITAQGQGNQELRKEFRTLATKILLLPIKSSSTGNLMLTQHAFSVLASFFGQENGDIKDLSLLSTIIKSILELRPNQNDVSLTPEWTNLVASGLTCYSSGITHLKTLSCWNEEELRDITVHERETLPSLVNAFFKNNFTLLLSDSDRVAVISSAAKAFASVVEKCLFDGMVQEAFNGNGILFGILGMTDNALGDIKFKDSWGGVLNISASLFNVITNYQYLLLILKYRD